MILRGDCLACDLLDECTKTSVDLVLRSFTCASFTPTPEAVYLARWEMMQQFGPQPAVESMLFQEPSKEETRSE